MKSVGLILLLLTLACNGNSKKRLTAQNPDGVTCGKGTSSLIESIDCLPAAVWTLNMEREGFSEKFSLRINQREIFNTCDSSETPAKISYHENMVSIQFGYLALPSAEENISLEIFNCEDGRRFAAAEPAKFSIAQDATSRVYSVSCELKKD
jgi:hypothetical protein